MTSMLVVMSVLFYTPFIMYVTVIESFEGGGTITSDFELIALPIVTTFIHLQSLINPIFVSLQSSYIRTRIKQKLVALFNWILHLILFDRVVSL